MKFVSIGQSLIRQLGLAEAEAASTFPNNTFLIELQLIKKYFKILMLYCCV